MRDYHFYSLVVEARRRKGERKLYMAMHELWVIYNSMLPLRRQVHGDDLDLCLAVMIQLPLQALRDAAGDAKRRTELFALSELDKKARRDVYKTTNKILKPLLRAAGFRSLAQLEHEYDIQE